MGQRSGTVLARTWKTHGLSAGAFLSSAKRQDRSSFLHCFCQRALKRIAGQSSFLLCFYQRALKMIAGQVFFASLLLPKTIEEDGRTGLLFFIASAKEHWRELQARSSFLLCFSQRAMKRITGQSASFLPNGIEDDCRTGLLCFCQKASKRIAW